MIYLITGVPGSGKTLYAVSTLIQKLFSQQTKDKNGVLQPRRLVVDNIKKLLLPHELMAGLVEDASGEFVPEDKEAQGLWNWQTWAQAGDIVVVDEVQRHWRPRGTGMKVPPEIKALETHRHKGIDFVIITQNPMLIDTNVRRLVGSHQHVRRIFGFSRALIYGWDGCQSNVNSVSGATKTMWGYPKSAYALYESSQLHTKQNFKIPLWLAVPVLAFIGLLFVAPKMFGMGSNIKDGKSIFGSSAAASAPVSAASRPASSAIPSMPAPPPPMPSLPITAPTSSTPIELADSPKFSGCIKSDQRCLCFDSKGSLMLPPLDTPNCEDRLAFNGRPAYKLPDHIPLMELVATHETQLAQARHDGTVFADMRRKR